MLDPHLDHDYGQQLANPPHVQKIERALRLEPFLSYVEELVQPVADSDTDIEITKPCLKDEEGNKILNGIQITKAGTVYIFYMVYVFCLLSCTSYYRTLKSNF